ncbi:high mobility group protein B3b [Hoplias malabaricus]|uniref:high mobility group protein B3b n=1 Tax=Hoplias malabaricus TaxID=27720 RepID=UPI0034621394
MAKNDPGKPKGKMSAYAYFVKTCREEHNKKNPGVPVNFAEFSKKCSERWKVMSPKEKTKFEDMAKQDKVRYDQEMMNYNPGKRGRTKLKKDPNAPRRPPSGFLLFCAEHRPSIKAQNPSYGIGDVAKKLGAMWNNMSDSEKQPFLSQANKLKDKYQKDMAYYRKTGKASSGASAGKSKSKDDDDDDDDDEEGDEEEDDEEEDEEEEDD